MVPEFETMLRCGRFHVGKRAHLSGIYRCDAYGRYVKSGFPCCAAAARRWAELHAERFGVGGKGMRAIAERQVRAGAHAREGLVIELGLGLAWRLSVRFNQSAFDLGWQQLGDRPEGRSGLARVAT